MLMTKISAKMMMEYLKNWLYLIFKKRIRKESVQKEERVPNKDHYQLQIGQF